MDIKLAKKFFWKTFIVSALFFVFSAIILIVGYDYFSETASQIYRITSEDFTTVFIYSMAFWKILIIQFTLIPAIVLTCMDKCSCKK